MKIWPAESLDAEERFGAPHAKLFPFLERRVRTPEGCGILLQVFQDRAAVLLDSERKKKKTLQKLYFCAPERIDPLDWNVREGMVIH